MPHHHSFVRRQRAPQPHRRAETRCRRRCVGGAHSATSCFEALGDAERVSYRRKDLHRFARARRGRCSVASVEREVGKRAQGARDAPRIFEVAADLERTRVERRSGGPPLRASARSMHKGEVPQGACKSPLLAARLAQRESARVQCGGHVEVAQPVARNACV